MTTTNINKYAFFYIYAFCCMQFYHYVGFDIFYLKLACFIIQILMLFLCRNQIFKRSSHPLYWNMQGILVSLLLSFVSAWIFWEQDLLLTYRAAASMFTFIFFFYLCKRKPSVEFLENFVWFFSILHCILWLYAFSQIPNPVFGGREEGIIDEDTSRGMIRLGVGGLSFVILALFLAINKFYTTHKRYFLAVAAIFFIFVVFSLTRQVIICSALVVAGYIFFKNKVASIVIVVVLAVYLALGNVIAISDDSVLGALINVTEVQVESNRTEDDIRIADYKYFFSDFQKNTTTSIIGSGMPNSLSPYGRFYDDLRENEGMYLSDVGYPMMYAVTGAIGLILYLMLFIISAFTEVPDRLSYVRMFMIYFIPANIAAAWYAKADCQLCMAISVYILMMYGQNRQTKRSKPHTITERVRR